ncbi:hypothetical protein AB9E15_33235, partial [Rhizobium leguminosarum]|uniref:hypothetical protein n=1 Tax=Rhizobium leguminosarum TaxID=384 RepID=UPI003F979A97
MRRGPRVKSLPLVGRGWGGVFSLCHWGGVFLACREATMKAFADLLDRLVLTPSRNGKLKLLT